MLFVEVRTVDVAIIIISAVDITVISVCGGLEKGPAMRAPLPDQDSLCSGGLLCNHVITGQVDCMLTMQVFLLSDFRN